MAAPRPQFLLRESDGALAAALREAGFDSIVSQFLAARLSEEVLPEELLHPRLADLPHPATIPDMERAVGRICRAIKNGERIVFAVDHDMDGQASAAVLWTAFTQFFAFPEEKLSVVSSHRLREGYGITPAVVERILSLGPTLVISADKGSSDEPRIAKLAEAGIDVIVTDHHAVPVEGPPASAYACVNPTRAESGFDPTICGAAVAFFCMALVRRKLIELSAGQEDAMKPPSLSPLLDYVAVATIADCVSLRPDRARVNRVLVRYGLEQINKQTRPCWAVFCAERSGDPVDSQTVGFQLVPAIAAAGRLDWADVGFDFLTAPNIADAKKSWDCLKQENAERKQVEKRVRDAAVLEVESKPLPAGIAIFLEEGHSGVHGITASRMVERYGRPTGVFAPRGQGQRDAEADARAESEATEVLSGSFRSIPALHMRDALQTVADREPGLLLSFGGHAGAAGASLLRSRFTEFAQRFEDVCAERLDGVELGPQVAIDAELPPHEISLSSAESLAALDPWGRDFPPPAFASGFVIHQCRPIGDGTHIKLTLGPDITGSTQRFDGVWFNAIPIGGETMPVREGEWVRLVYRLQVSTWRGRRRLQLQVVDRWDD